jgi:tetratricopeptide (TPR) repeat protein
MMGASSAAKLRRAAVLLLLSGMLVGPQPGRGQASGKTPMEMILVDSNEQATKIQRQLEGGDDFAALAHKYSIDPSASEGGYLGKLDPQEMRLELRDALKGIGPGHITSIVKLPSGYAILKVLKDTLGVEANEADPTRLLPVDAQSSARLTTDRSGYQELMQSIRNRIPNAKWGLDLKAVCATRQQAPLDAIAALREQLNKAGPKSSEDQSVIHFDIGELLSATGNIDGAIGEWEQAYLLAKSASAAELVEALEEVLGTGYLRRASLPDRSNHPPVNQSWLIPSHPGAPQAKPSDVAKAIEHLTKSLAYDRSKTEIQWLLNLAHMMNGTYPAGVPKEILIAPSVFASKEDLGRFPDVAPAAGVDVYGTAGGAIADDFDNDGLLDIVTSEIDDCAPLHYFHNNGNGTFTDRAVKGGLADQTGGLNIIQADYNNDGCVDILVLRGGWEFPRRRSLLRNNCDGTFTDVTAQSGLLEPIRSSQSAVWADIDNDGKLDLFIANENAPAQLFLNLGDGTFADISNEAGIGQRAFSKAVVSADYDNDGYPDFYVSNSNGQGFLYHNNGDRTFSEVSGPAGVKANRYSFASWFFDYDNDGWPDLFVTSYFFSAEEPARSYLGLPRKGETLKLFKNMQDGTFRDVTAETGLDRVFLPMGANFGDIDNDGYPDIYLGMGTPSFATVFPNTLLHNQEGKRFVDISTSSGTGAISKGHGVAFADFDNTGEEDIFVVMGGPSIGDRGTSRLFKNPGHGNDWITLRLVGEKSNRSAIGARIAVTVTNSGGSQRTVYRTVGSGGSFGASPLRQHIGLGKAAHIENIEIWWPASKTRQKFTDVKPNQFLEIKESATSPAKLDYPSFRLGGPSGSTPRVGASH